jgi:hypothetical protein
MHSGKLGDHPVFLWIKGSAEEECDERNSGGGADQPDPRTRRLGGEDLGGFCWGGDSVFYYNFKWPTFRGAYTIIFNFYFLRAIFYFFASI